MDLTLSQLACFLASLDTGSFTAAAERLGISQPAVAEQVQRLERVVGQSLFAREPRGVAPTAAGRDLAPHARRAVDAADAAAEVMSAAASEGGRVGFGTFASPDHYGLTALVADTARAYPSARLRILSRNSSATADAVRVGELDAAVATLPVDDTGLEVQPLFDSQVLYVSHHALHTRSPVTIEVAAGRELILYEASVGTADPTRSQLAARAQAAGVRLEPRIEVETPEAALALAADGLGDTYAPSVLRGALDERLNTTPFDPPLIDTVALLTRRGARLPTPTTHLVDRIVEHLRAVTTELV